MQTSFTFPEFASVIEGSYCGPSDINGAAPVVVAPAVPGLRDRAISRTYPHAVELQAWASSVLSSWGVPAKSEVVDTLPETGQAVLVTQLPSVQSSVKSLNLDLTGAKLVKRGALVSWGGCRFKVLRVVAGRAYYGESFSNSVACGLVRVVA